MALPDGKEPDTADESPVARESGVAPLGSFAGADMTDRSYGVERSTVAHSIMPEPGEVEAVDGGWGDDDEPTQPPSEPITIRLSDALEFDIPKAAPLPAMFPPPAPIPPDVAHDPPESTPCPPSGPPTLRITTRPPSTPASRPSNAPGYGYRASQRPDLSGEMKARFADGDFSGALVFAEAVLAADAAHEDANLYASSCRVGLSEAYLAELGGRDAIAYLAVPRGDLVALDLDPDHGFVVSQLDGMATIDDVIDVCGKPEHETLRVLHDLFKRGVASVKA